MANCPVMFIDVVKLQNMQKKLKNKTPQEHISEILTAGPNELPPSSYYYHSSFENLLYGIREFYLPFFQSSLHMGPSICSRQRCLTDGCTNK